MDKVDYGGATGPKTGSNLNKPSYVSEILFPYKGFATHQTSELLSLLREDFVRVTMY